MLRVFINSKCINVSRIASLPAGQQEIPKLQFSSKTVELFQKIRLVKK